MSNYEKFFQITDELKMVLEDRIKLKENTRADRYNPISRKCCKAKIRRLRLDLAQVLLRIEEQCETGCFNPTGKEPWNE